MKEYIATPAIAMPVPIPVCVEILFPVRSRSFDIQPEVLHPDSTNPNTEYKQVRFKLTKGQD